MHKIHLLKRRLHLNVVITSLFYLSFNNEKKMFVTQENARKKKAFEIPRVVN